MGKSCNDCIAQQIKDKEERIRNEIEEDRAYGAKLKDVADAAEIAEGKVQKKRKEKLLEQQAFLKEQVAGIEKRKLEQRAEISETEKLINKKLLDAIQTGEKQQSEIKVD